MTDTTALGVPIHIAAGCAALAVTAFIQGTPDFAAWGMGGRLFAVMMIGAASFIVLASQLVRDTVNAVQEMLERQS